MRPTVDLGILYSRSGTYATLSEAFYRGAMSGISEVNASDAYAVRFNPVARDPGGNADRYAPLCAEILGTSGAKHVIGCVTSSSRKEVIPVLDRTNAMLWYNAPYEGFEASNRVIYAHACANQHLLPLLNWCFEKFGTAPYVTGSNYIWGWETCRVARTRAEEAGGMIKGERYLPLGDEDVSALIADIEAARPDFVLNSLVGASSYAFIKAYVDLGRRDAHFRPGNCPIVSCNLTECELPKLGDAAEGLISVGPHFCTKSCVTGHGSSLEMTAHWSVLTLARMLSLQGDRAFADLLTADGAQFGLDPDTNHRTLDVTVAQVRGGLFESLAEWSAVAPDPYLTRPARHPRRQRPNLSLVSQ